MQKLLAVDLDGTLFYPKKTNRCISKRNCKFLQKWIDLGNKVVLITSRSTTFIERLKKEIQRPFDFLTCNSANVSINGELVRDISIPRDTIQDLVEKINVECHPIGYLLTTKKYNLIIRNNLKRSKFLLFCYLIYHKLQFKYREDFVLDNDVFDKELAEGDVQKMMIFFGLRKKNYDKAKAINKELRAKYPDAEFSWSNQVVELTPKNCNKGDGLEYYCNVSNISKDNVYVVGDSGNDIAMFNKFHEHSYCMAHSYPSVKKYAKHIISRVHKLDKLVLKGEKPHESN